MSSPLTAEVLRGACECVASLSLGTGGLTAVDAAVETHLEALDEASSTLEASRAHIADAVDAGFPSLRANTAELRALFAAVEAAEASVARVAAAARAASERLEALERHASPEALEAAELAEAREIRRQTDDWIARGRAGARSNADVANELLAPSGGWPPAARA